VQQIEDKSEHEVVSGMDEDDENGLELGVDSRGTTTARSNPSSYSVLSSRNIGYTKL
jgi:hypothetical protein